MSRWKLLENYKSVDDRFPFSDRFYYDFAGENEATESIRKMFSPENPRFERSSTKGMNVVNIEKIPLPSEWHFSAGEKLKDFPYGCSRSTSRSNGII